MANSVFKLSDQHGSEFQLDSFQYVEAEKIKAALAEGSAAAQASS